MCPSTAILTFLRNTRESANINCMHVGTISRAKDQIFKGLKVSTVINCYSHSLIRTFFNTGVAQPLPTTDLCKRMANKEV